MFLNQMLLRPHSEGPSKDEPLLVIGRQWRWAAASGAVSGFPSDAQTITWRKSVKKAGVQSCGFVFGPSWVQIPPPPLTSCVSSVASSVKWEIVTSHRNMGKNH